MQTQNKFPTEKDEDHWSVLKIDQFFFSETKSTIDPLNKTENQTVQV